MPQLSSETEVSIYLLYSTHYTAVQIKNCLKCTSVIKVATMKNTNDFHYAKEAITKSTLFTVSKDEWNTKEDTGKSMKNVLHILWYAKSTSQGEMTSNSEKIKPVALLV